MRDFEPCRNEHLEAHDLARRLGALRFEQPCRLFLGRIAHEEGGQQLAVENLRKAEEVAQRTSLAFHGPMIYGALAFVLDRPDDLGAALAQAELIIGQGCVSHNQLWFYPDAIDVALDLFDFDAAERYVSALEDFTRAEPLPWSDFFVARGRALIATGPWPYRSRHSSGASAPPAGEASSSAMRSPYRRCASCLRASTFRADMGIPKTENDPRSGRADRGRTCARA